MTDQAASDDVTGIMLDALNTVIENQATLNDRLDSQTRSLAAIAVAIGFTFVASGSANGLPQDVLEDPAFALFLQHYPLDGPAIVGDQRMAELVAQLDRENPARLAAAFRDLERLQNISEYERIRNRQIERAARQRFGDLDKLEQAKER